MHPQKATLSGHEGNDLCLRLLSAQCVQQGKEHDYIPEQRNEIAHGNP
jgi:hypothetical protein